MKLPTKPRSHLRTILPRIRKKLPTRGLRPRRIKIDCRQNRIQSSWRANCCVDSSLVFEPSPAALSVVLKHPSTVSIATHMSAIATPIAARAALTAGPARCAHLTPGTDFLHLSRAIRICLHAPCQSLIGGRVRAATRARWNAPFARHIADRLYHIRVHITQVHLRSQGRRR